MMKQDGDTAIVLSRFDGETHQMSINGSVEYSSPTVAATFDDSFELVSATPGDAVADGDAVSLTAATMFAVWKGLDESMPQIPVAGDAGTKIEHPTYAE